MATQKCSARRVSLMNLLNLVQEMITLNESVDRTRRNLVSEGHGELGMQGVLNNMLASGGPPTTISTSNNGTLADFLQYDLGKIEWEFEAE